MTLATVSLPSTPPASGGSSQDVFKSMKGHIEPSLSSVQPLGKSPTLLPGAPYSPQLFFETPEAMAALPQKALTTLTQEPPQSQKQKELLTRQKKKNQTCQS